MLIGRLASGSLRERLNGETFGLMRRAGVMIAVRIASTILTLVYTILITRTTTTEGTGHVMFAMSVALIASVAFSVNVESGSIRYLVKYRADGDNSRAKGFVLFGRNFILVTTMIAAIAGAIYVGVVGTANLTPTGWVFIIAIAMCPFVAITRLLGRQGTALDGVLQSTLPRMLVRPLVFTAVLGFAWLQGYSLTPAVIMGLFFLSVVLVAVLQFVLLRRFFDFTKNVRSDFSDWKSWMSTGFKLSPSLVLQEYMKDLIIAAAAIAIAPAQVAFVAVAISVTNFLNFSISAVDVSFGPRFARCAAAGDKARIARLTAVSTLLKCIGVLVGSILLLYFGEQILGLFGPEYRAANTLLVVFLLLPLTNALLGPSTLLLNIHGHPSSIFYATTIGLCLIVILTPVGGYLFGSIGAAFGTAIGFMIMQSVLYFECRRKTGVDASLYAAITKFKSIRH